jgi:hypothetical protein
MVDDQLIFPLLYWCAQVLDGSTCYLRANKYHLKCGSGYHSDQLPIVVLIRERAEWYPTRFVNSHRKVPSKLPLADLSTNSVPITKKGIAAGEIPNNSDMRTVLMSQRT